MARHEQEAVGGIRPIASPCGTSRHVRPRRSDAGSHPIDRVEPSGCRRKISHGRPTFFTKKVFTYYGGAVRHGAGDWEQHPQSFIVMLDSDERAALLEEPGTYVPAYLGPTGWLGIDVSPRSDFEEVAELIESSYRNTAPARLVAALDT